MLETFLDQSQDNTPKNLPEKNDFKNLEDLLKDSFVQEIIREVSGKLSQELLSHVLESKSFYYDKYEINEDHAIDQIWFKHYKELLIQCVNFVLEKSSANDYSQNLSLLKEEIEKTDSLSDFTFINFLSSEIKNFIFNITRSLKYKNNHYSVFLGEADPTKIIHLVKEWLKEEISRKQDPRFGFLEEHDKNILEKATPSLLKILNEQKEKGSFPKTFVYLTTGSRLLSYFVKGLMEDMLSHDSSQPIIQYVQCSRSADQNEKNLIFKRVEEMVKSSPPPYLIIDDYVTENHKTYSFIKEAFQKAGVSDKDFIFFAFISEAENFYEDKNIPPEHYTRLGINFGIQDRYGSSDGFLFNKDPLKGTQKNPKNKYETVIQISGETFHDKYANVTKADLKKNIRNNLYYFGKSFSREQ